MEIKPTRSPSPCGLPTLAELLEQVAKGVAALGPAPVEPPAYTDFERGLYPWLYNPEAWEPEPGVDVAPYTRR